ncbi:hypothetical protein M7I_4031 [Glarea lozoyensis 74030]|uniref:ubiquitinyl hydrolase 1 n=1 Tax=Glarea lozoyensis (strain ATCC 74030 / MF5533) TaxID=1104152 RepID=H0EN30_GLAL7|nr:hypothetical protein M7I_4031 [Glarea lozoyensis 74030]
MAIIKSLIAFATVDELKTIAMPEWSTFTHFEDAEKPEAELIRERIKNCVIPFTFKQAKPRGSRARSDSDVQLKFKHEEKQNKDTRAFVKHVLQQWPCSEPSIEGFPKSDAFNFTLALELILLEWHRMYRNADLAKYLLKVQEVLDQHYSPQDYDVPTLESEERVILPTRHRGGELLTLGDLLRMSCVSDELNMSRRRHPIQIRTNNQALTSAPSDAIGFADYAVLSKDARDLRKIIHDFITAESPVRHQYGKDLMDSYEALEKFQSATWARAKDNHAFLSARVRTEQRVLDTHFSQLFYAFESVDPRARWLKKAQLWPRVTAVTLLESLRSSAASISMGSGVRECLIRFGVSISNLQRLNRIHEAGLRNQRQKLAEEEANPGHENWDPSVYTDWLLLEIDSDFTIRPGQIDVGNATINPPSGSNSVLQMNMGQAIKTQLIYPSGAQKAVDGHPSRWEIAQEFSEGGHFPHKKEIHLLRGLLVEGILVTALKKRWNVQYGLHRARDPIAVPYHAKGTPSEQAEWGHPDVAILLTCLSFYYDGLSIEQLRQSLQHIQSSDDPCQTYAGISYSSNLPTTLTDWNTVNIDDDIQIRQLWQDYKGRRLSEEGLLHEITNRGIRVLIDAGAQILELSNSDLATAWMSIHGNAPAIIYFKGNEPAPLFASAYAEDLGECLVYLDEAHTRGTDLKISAKAKGALTLGLGQTKDHTVQAALRLRQLATSQSLVFFAPPEVHQSILDYRNKTKENFIDSYDVIHWLMEQTCRGNELLQSLYVAQGYDFYVRRQAALKNAKFLTYKIQRDLYLDCLRKPEEQTLEELYGPHQRREESLPLSSFSPAIQTQLYKLNKQRMSFHNTAGVAHTSAFHEVEQEREVAHEVENVREVQKQVDYIPHVFHSLHEDIQKFMEIGEFTAKSSAYKQAWLEIDKTSLGIKHPINISAISSRLLVSIEFTKTIKIAKSSSSDPDLGWGTNSRTTRDLPDHSADNFLRSFSWSAQTALLTYAAPVTRKMLHFNDLKYYTMPDLPSTWTAPPNWLKGELGIFAGRLYFQYDEYKWLCNFLGIDNSPKSESTNKATGILDEKALIAENIWTLRAKAEAVKKPTTFTPKPLVFMQEWLSLRRKGQDFAHTPMGFVCQGKPLGPDHPFFKVVKNVVHVPVAGNKAEVVEREEEGSDVDLYDDEYEHDEDGEEYGNEDDEGKDGNDGHDDGVTIGGDS